MARTCIICGAPARSREHVFPATLGGRRENRGIYCAEHNAAYSPLVNELADQLRFINAELEVLGAHSGQVKPAEATVIATGATVRTTGTRLWHEGAPKIVDETSEGVTTRTITFSDRESAERWAMEERAQGRDVRIQRDGISSQHHVGRLHVPLTFGGPLGLRAIAYIAQTFFAEAFPELARSPALDALKAYTLLGEGPVLAWQVFDPIEELEANTYPFGHRVVVGVHAGAGLAYAQVSLFGTYHVNVQIGHQIDDSPSSTTITDIDPFARQAPDDSTRWTIGPLVVPLRLPEEPTSALADAIQSGRAEAMVGDLMRRIADEKRRRSAAVLFKILVPLTLLRSGERHGRVRMALRAYSGHVLALIEASVAHLRTDEGGVLWQLCGEAMEAMSARDPETLSGLTPLADQTLALCLEVIAGTLEASLEDETLTESRLEALLGKGPGLELVSRVMLGTLMRAQLSSVRRGPA
jgi:hypothetical protein